MPIRDPSVQLEAVRLYTVCLLPIYQIADRLRTGKKGVTKALKARGITVKKRAQQLPCTEVVDLYSAKLQSISSIAAHFHTSKSCVRQALLAASVRIRSKGETNTEPLTGAKYGKLTVLHQVPRPTASRTANAWWRCRCECGNEVTAKAIVLKRGEKQSCGCSWKASYMQLSGAYFSSLRSGAKARSLDFEVTPEFLWNLYSAQDKKCALSGVEIALTMDDRTKTASLDRIDSKRGYVLDNVQWVHKSVNRMKSNLAQEDFLHFVARIASRHVRNATASFSAAPGTPIPARSLNISGFSGNGTGCTAA